MIINVVGIEMKRSWSMGLILILSAIAPYLVAKDTEEYPDIYYETFDHLDESKWLVQLYSFINSGSNMLPDSVTFENSIMTLTVDKDDQSELEKPFNGGEIGDYDFTRYGYYEVRMRPRVVSGTVGSFFLMNQWVSEDWEHKEIDIEFTGNLKTSIRMTTHDYREGGKVHKYSSTDFDLGFDITEQFHTYAILWEPDAVSWFVEDTHIHTERKYVPNVPLQIRVNHWAGNQDQPFMVDWHGAIDANELPATVEYDWIRVTSLEDYYARDGE